MAAIVSERPAMQGYGNYLRASLGMALLMILRRQRLILATVLTLLPVVIPLAMAFLSKSAYAEEGRDVFVQLVEGLHINVFGPLLGLFFAMMLVGEDVESNTLPYVLTRPIPRSAWVLGRFVAYMIVAAAILVASIGLTFAACTSLSGITFSGPDIKLAGQYAMVATLALLAYGALSMWLGATTKRPIVYGVLLLYGWQRLAMVVPGLVDFLTIQKYTDALLPALAEQRQRMIIESVMGEFSKEVFIVGAGKAFVTLVAVSAVFLLLTIQAVRNREYAAGRAVGG